MPHLRRFVRLANPLALALLLVFAGGCGTGEYRRLFNHAVGLARTGAPFRTLFGHTQLIGTPVRIRVPKAFKRSFTADSSEHGAKVSPQRIEPPFLRLPGFRLCYEGTADDAAGLVPFYCYLCALPSKPGDADKLAAELATQLNDKFKDAKAEWEPIDAYSPDGKAKAWKKIRITGEQDFFVNTGQKEEVKKLPGIFELWMCDAPDWIVLVGWRTPTSIDGAPPPPDPKAKGGDEYPKRPDFSTPITGMPTLAAGTLVIDPTVESPAP